MKTFACLLLLAVSLGAQTRSVVLTWADTQNPAGTTYNVYRAPGACPTSGTPAYVNITATPLAVKTFTDPVAIGTTNCYSVTAVSGTTESLKAVPVVAVAGPFLVTGLSVVVQ